MLPKEERFFALFDGLAAHGVAAAKTFHELTRRWSCDSPLLERLHEIEQEADITTHEVKDRLDRSFITPYDREDIHALTSKLDDVVDIIQSASNRMRLYRLPSCRPEIVALADILHQAALAVARAVACLSDPSRKRRLLDHCIEINRLENEGDQALGAALGAVFADVQDPIAVIKWERICETLETAIDKCEDVAHVLESILVKNG
ncbi:MAG: DUF47 family protein [Elusimicrobia bacterium]|nr:DUF47 family protein [Elusimicrobiota bacterium]